MNWEDHEWTREGKGSAGTPAEWAVHLRSGGSLLSVITHTFEESQPVGPDSLVVDSTKLELLPDEARALRDALSAALEAWGR